MKGKKRLLATLTSVAMLIGCIAMPVSADSSNVVTTWEELKDAIAAVPTNADSATSITLGANITTLGMIRIEKDKDVLLEMNGYTLERSIQAQDADGHVIIVDSGAHLQIYGSGHPDRGNGTIKGGFANNGGGINNKGTLDISYVDIINNNVGDTTAADNTRGGGIWNSGTLFLGACTISGNKADDGGGIFNDEGGTVTLNAVTVTNNTSLLHGGGGIVNYGSITFLGNNTITGNTSKSNGGGVWNKGTFTIDDSDNRLIIKDNDSTDYLTDNLYLQGNTVMAFTDDGSLSSEAEIHVFAPNTPRPITSGWPHGTSSQTMIIPESDMLIDYNSNGELIGTPSYTYIERAWVNGAVQETVKPIPSNAVPVDNVAKSTQYWDNGVVSLNSTWVYVDHDAYWEHPIQARGDVHIILKDGVTFTCTKGIWVVGTDSSLTIYGQSTDSGTLISTGGSREAGIGGHQGNTNAVENDAITGMVCIHGGTVKATGGDEAAGIGSGKKNMMSSIVIYGGKIEAQGGKGAAGLGVGASGYVSNILIYGGEITAKGGTMPNYPDFPGAGIGGADNSTSSITINGGTIHAYGDGGGAGIGSNGYGYDCYGQNGTITINGGTVYAYGSLGKKEEGGSGHSDEYEEWMGGAGIGAGGGFSSSGTIRITGGYVHAESPWSCAIGAGYARVNRSAANIEITGGEVVAKVNDTRAAAIGGFDKNGDLTDGNLVLYAGAKVFANDVLQPSSNRVSACRGRGREVADYQVHIKPCDHPSITYTKDVEGHKAACGYCATAFTKEAHHYDSHNKCTVCGYERSAPVCKGHSVLLKEGKIGLKFFMDLSGLTEAERDSGYMTFDIAGKGTVTNESVTSSEPNSAGYYEYVVELNAIQMADEITATFHYVQDGVEKTVVETYSVKQYCIDFDKSNIEKGEKEIALTHALADYGHYLQLYLKGIRGWSFDSENGYTQMDKFYNTYTSSDTSIVTTGSTAATTIARDIHSSDIKAITYSMTFDSDTCINIYFEMTDGVAYEGEFQVDIVGGYGTYTPGTRYPLMTGEMVILERCSDGRYCLKITGICAQNLDKMYSISVNTDSTMSTNGDAANIGVCGLSYARSLAENSTSEGSDEAAVAIYRYYLAAKEYVG